MQSIWLLVFLLVLSGYASYAEEQLHGEICVFSKYNTATLSQMVSKKTLAYDEHYSWGRKKTSRYFTTYEVGYFTKTVVTHETRCCSGWRTSQRANWCDTHDLKPVVEFCPTTVDIVLRSASHDNVTWFAPTFKEPWGKPIHVTNQYGGETGVLKWGENKIEYVATSLNNKLTANCTITVDVRPSTVIPKVINYENKETITVDENTEQKFTCVANYSNQVTQDLEWYQNITKITSGINYTTAASELKGYHHSTSILTITIDRQNQGALTCLFTPNNQTFTIPLKVHYEVAPIVTYKPYDSETESPDRVTRVRWSPPTFIDPANKDPIDVTSNFDGVTDWEFTWGKHKIVYTATNRRNRLTTSVTFYAIVKPVDCSRDDILPDGNGALICGYNEHHIIQACHPVCFYNGSYVALKIWQTMSICTADGRWLPTPQKIDCTTLTETEMCLEKECQVGTCTDSNITDSIITDFSQKMSDSEFNDVCGNIPDHPNVRVKLYCKGDK